MTSLVRWMGRRAANVERSGALSLDQWASYFNFGGIQYPFIQAQQTLSHKQEEIYESFTGYCQQVYKDNGVVFSCMAVRQLLFSEARFQFRQIRSGRPGDLFGTPALLPLEIPWQNGTTGDLLSHMIQDADISGNSYHARKAVGKTFTIRRLRPDWVTIVLGSQIDAEKASWQSDAEVIGYVYWPGGMRSGEPPETFLPNEIAHWAPYPDPEAHFRGMSWITPVIREVLADKAASTHKLMFFENGATPNMVVSLDKDITIEAFNRWVDTFEEEHKGFLNAYKTLYMGGGAAVKVVGSDMKQLDFKVTQGAGETRIAAAAGVPPVIAGFSEGLQAATYSNYSQARRRFADGTMRPLWRSASAALAPIIEVPLGSELWYDDRDIPFLQEDVKDAAEIQQIESQTITALIKEGFEPDSVIDAVTAQDWARLKHTGLVSVQLQPPGTVAAGAQQPQLPKPTEGKSSCYVCGQNGAGLTYLPDGRTVHLWPCVDRLRDQHALPHVNLHINGNK